MVMESSLCRGWVQHRRLRPVEHAFRYSLFMLYIDLSEIDRVFRRRWFWSTKYPALAWFRRRDYLGQSDLCLDTVVRDLVESRGYPRPKGPIRLLTHLRYFGWMTNPVSFYYCFDREGKRVESIVAEITNTPWGERHSYVIHRSNDPGCSDDEVLQCEFQKAFHVSPFHSMDQTYHWRMSEPNDRLLIEMKNEDAQGNLFDVTLSLARHPLSGPELSRALFFYPAMTFRVFVAIYMQALKLRLKGCPIHVHPKKRSPEEPQATDSRNKKAP